MFAERRLVLSYGNSLRAQQDPVLSRLGGRGPQRYLERFCSSKGSVPWEKNCLLFPYPCVPFDSSSLQKIRKFLHGTPFPDYFSLLAGLRERFLIVMEKDEITLPEFRCMDSTGEYITLDRQLVYLP